MTKNERDTMAQDDTLTTTINAIYSLSSLDELRAVTYALNQREKELRNREGAAIRRTMQVGGEARFSDQVRPKYLTGKVGTVVKINAKSVVMDFPVDPSYGRFSGSKKVRCPLSLIEA